MISRANLFALDVLTHAARIYPSCGCMRLSLVGAFLVVLLGKR